MENTEINNEQVQEIINSISDGSDYAFLVRESEIGHYDKMGDKIRVISGFSSKKKTVRFDNMWYNETMYRYTHSSIPSKPRMEKYEAVKEVLRICIPIPIPFDRETFNRLEVL